MANVGSSPDFHDFDDANFYNRCEAAILKPDIFNIVIEFDSAKARAALDVENSDAMKKILDIKVRES